MIPFYYTGLLYRSIAVVNPPMLPDAQFAVNLLYYIAASRRWSSSVRMSEGFNPGCRAVGSWPKTGRGNLSKPNLSKPNLSKPNLSIPELQQHPSRRRI